MKPPRETYGGEKIHRFIIRRGYNNVGFRWVVYFDSKGHCVYPCDTWPTRKEALADFMEDARLCDLSDDFEAAGQNNP